jgi:hypothetical protein
MPMLAQPAGAPRRSLTAPGAGGWQPRLEPGSLPLTSMSWAPSHVCACPNRNSRGQQGTGPTRSPPPASLTSISPGGQVDIVAINGMLLRSPAPGQQAGRRAATVTRPPRRRMRCRVRRCAAQALRRTATRRRRHVPAPSLGGGLDPGGAWGPSRQRKLPKAAPGPKDSQALFPVPTRRCRERRNDICPVRADSGDSAGIRRPGWRVDRNGRALGSVLSG